MSIDTTFRPTGPTVLVGVVATQVGDDLSSGCSTFRVRCVTAGYLSWGTSAVTAKGAPAAGAPVANTIGMAAGGVGYFELPYNVYFISSVADGFEVTPGQGGTGG